MEYLITNQQGQCLGFDGWEDDRNKGIRFELITAIAISNTLCDTTDWENVDYEEAPQS